MSFRKMALSLGLLSVLGAAAPSFAAENPALRAMIQSRDQMVAHFQQSQLSSMAQDTLDAAVAAGIQALRRENHRATADQLESEYNERFAHFFQEIRILGDLGMQDIGDHKPLSQWLANYYEILKSKLGGGAIKQGILGDIWTLNYAIPVSFSPRNGEWRTHQDGDRIEYRKHFIPMSGVLTYYVSLIACQRVAATQGIPKQVCQKAATELKAVTVRYIAPKVSDYIFLSANKQKADWTVTQDDLVYLTADELEKAISTNGGVL